MSSFKGTIEARMAEIFRQEREAATTPAAKQLIERIAVVTLRSGKRSRPRLLRLTYQGYGGKHQEDLVDIGVALELQHQFLLVHDDIMDNDTVRYDGPNITGLYREDYPAGQSTIAESMALMAGNLLFTFACQAILKHPHLPADKKLALLSLLQDTNVAVHAGQQLDIVNLLALDPEIDTEKLLLTDYLKTAVYTVQQPMQAVAELLDLKPAERARINDFARASGILYQLADDYSDYFVNNSSLDNHPKFRDFRQGKITYPLLKGFELANTADKIFLKKHAGDKDSTGATMKRVADILESCGAKAAAREQLEDYYRLGLAALERLAITPETKPKFVAVLDSLRV